MKYLYCLSFISFFWSNAVAQDATSDRWVDSGDQTVINVPSTNDGRVVISKFNPQPLVGFSELLRLQGNSSSFEYLSFRNATTVSGSFIPALFAYNATTPASALMMIGVTNSIYDESWGAPMLNFNARRYVDNTLNSGGGPLLNRPLFAWTNFTTVHMQMLANGNLGIGTTSPQSQLHTTGTVRFGGLPTGAGTSVVMTDINGNLSRYTLPASTSIATLSTSVGSNVIPRLNDTGTFTSSQLSDDGTNIGVGGAPSSNAKLTLYGTMSLMSDARTKTNIVRVGNALRRVSALNGYYYDWKTQSTGREVGFLAQEVEQVLPEVVSENEQGTKFVNYNGVLPLLTEAIKEQQQTIETQSKTIGELRNLVELLRLEVADLKRKR